jgi:ABC-type transporter Mla subunit MlaD
VGLWDDIGDAASDVGDALGDAAEAVGEAIEDGVEALGDAAEAVGEFAEDAVEALAELAEDALEELAELAGEALDAAEDVYEAFAELAEEAWEGATDIVEDAADALADAVEEAWEGIAEAAEQAWEQIAEAAEDAWHEIVEAAEELYEAATDAVEALWDAAVAAVERLYDAAATMYELALDAIERTLAWLGDLAKDVVQAIAMLGECLAGIVVHTLAEADNVILNFGKMPKALPQSFRDEVKGIFPNVPFEKVFYIENASLSANHFGKFADAMTFMNPEIAGVNLGYMIYLDDAWDQTTKRGKGLMVHELVHVEQYRRFKVEDAFACAYGIGYANAGFDYATNPLEAEAFAVQKAYENAP